MVESGVYVSGTLLSNSGVVNDESSDLEWDEFSDSDSGESDSDGDDSDVGDVGDHPTSGSGPLNACSIKNLHKIQPSAGCRFLNDNNSRLQYSPGWILNSSDPNVPRYTVHLAQHPGASVFLTLNASSIIVFGLVPSGPSPPRASYTIDGLAPVSPQLAATSECVSNIQLFNSSTGLTDVGQLHNITISVTQASVDQPYILDHVWLCKAETRIVQVPNPNITTVPGNRDPGPTAPARAQGLSVKDAVIISLASLGLVIVLAFGVYIYIRFWATRKKTQRLQDPLDSNMQTERDTSLDTDVPELGTPISTHAQSGLEGTPHPNGSVNLSSLEEGITWPASSRVRSSRFTEGHDRPLSHSRLWEASITPYTAPDPRSEKATLFLPLPPFRTLPSDPSTLQEEGEAMGGYASEDDEPPPTYVSS